MSIWFLPNLCWLFRLLFHRVVQSTLRLFLTVISCSVNAHMPTRLIENMRGYQAHNRNHRTIQATEEFTITWLFGRLSLVPAKIGRSITPGVFCLVWLENRNSAQTRTGARWNDPSPKPTLANRAQKRPVMFSLQNNELTPLLLSAHFHWLLEMLKQDH